MAPHLLSALRSDAAGDVHVAAFAVAYWAREAAAATAAGAPAGLLTASASGLEVLAALQAILASPPAALPRFAELVSLHAQLRSQASALLRRALQAGLPLSMPTPLDSLAADGALALVAQVAQHAQQGASDDVGLAAQALQSTAQQLATAATILRTSVCAAAAAAVVHAGALPPKLNGVIQPLVGAVRREPQPCMQDEAAVALAGLIVLCTARTPSPNDK